MLCSYKQKNNRLLTVHNLRSVVSTNDLSKGRFGWGGVGGGEFGNCEWLVCVVGAERGATQAREN